MDSQEHQWAEAMRAAQAGCGASYARLLSEVAAALRGPLRAKLSRLGFSAAEAEDIVQDVLIALHRRRDSWDPARPFLPWLGVLTRRRLVDALRRLGRAQRCAGAASLDDVAESLGAQLAATDPPMERRERLVAVLPTREREVVTALGLEGQSVPVVAERFAITEGAVRVAFHRGLARLRSMASTVSATRKGER